MLNGFIEGFDRVLYMFGTYKPLDRANMHLLHDFIKHL